jgi:hypothetical protein
MQKVASKYSLTLETVASAQDKIKGQPTKQRLP